MKVKKLLGVLFTCLGCAAAFVGLAATVLPMIQNDQLQLVLSSFETPSHNPVVNLMNSAMTYALHNCYLVMLAGAAGAVMGALLLLSAQNAAPPRQEQRRATRLRDGAPPRQPTYAPNPAPMPVWRSSKADEAVERNPFANPALGDLLAPRTADSGRGPREEPEVPSFAPKKTVESAPAAAPRFRYEAPPAVAVPERSPYERPVSDAPKAVRVFAEEPAPEASYPIGTGVAAVARPESLVRPPEEAGWQAEPPAAEAVAPAVSAPPRVFPMPTAAPAAATAPTVPAVPQVAFSTAAPASTMTPAPVVPQATFSTAAPVAPLSPVSPAPSVPLPDAAAPAPKQEATKVRIKSTMGKHTL